MFHKHKIFCPSTLTVTFGLLLKKFNIGHSYCIERGYLFNTGNNNTIHKFKAIVTYLGPCKALPDVVNFLVAME